MRGLLSGASARAWLVVAAVGALVVIIVLALSLIGRLGSGQDVLDELGPAMTEERVAGTRAGVNQISKIVDLADPLTTQRGGGAAEAPKLVALVASGSGLSRGEVGGVLRREAPHAEALLRALPLSAVRRELPGVKRLIGRTLDLTPEQTDAALAKDFPRLAQVLTQLPYVTSGWNSVPNIDGATRFNGEPIRSVPDVRDYFSRDVVPVLESQSSNFRDLDRRGGIGVIPWLLLAVGVVVLAYGLLMARRTAGGARAGVLAWAVVPVVGVAIIALVLVLELFPRLDGGQELLDRAKPAFTDERVQADVAGARIVSHIVDLSDPIALESGGATAEVPKLVRALASGGNLSSAEVTRALEDAAPQTLALLSAIPLSAVAEEVPGLLAVLARAMRVSGDALVATLQRETPGLAQSLLAVGPVTAGWERVPGIDGMTRFSGKPVRAVRDVRDYLSDDLVPAVASTQDDFNDLESTWPPVDVFPPLLLAIGLIVLLYGGLMTLSASREGPGPRPRSSSSPGDGP